MTALIYDRKTNTAVPKGDAYPRESGQWGKITLKSLCETIDKFGGIPAGHKVTHLVIEGDTISYRVEPRGGRNA